MPDDSLESARVFRTAAWIWIGYLVSLAFMDGLIYAGQPLQPILGYHLVNAAPALLFLALAYSGWLKTRSRVLIPLLILLLAVAPTLLNSWLDLRLPPAPLANVEGMILRRLPALFLGLVLTAWHYRLGMMLAYSLGTYGIELGVAWLLGPLDGERQALFYFVATIRTISLIVVGVFITQLITRLRAQQQALRSANLELAQHARTLETLAVSRERNRLARELHDTLAHTLSGLTVQLETTKAYWEAQPETARELLIKSLATARSGLDETRRALKSLRASPLEDLGLLLALRRLAETAAGRGGLKLELVLPGQLPALSADVEQCVYRVAQEAVENVLRHAQAATLSVRLAATAGDLTLAVQDDGRGADLPQAEQAGHFGLAGMRERAALAGGSLAIHSSPGQGTRVELVVKGLRA